MWLSVISIVLVSSFVHNVQAAPINDNSALLYLSQFGYIPKSRFNSSAIVDHDKFSSAIADFQSFAGLNVTGSLDDETVQTMSLPRCGVQDKVGTGNDKRSKRYALQGSRWKVKDLVFKITKYPKKLKRNDVDKAIQTAFNVWSRYTDLTFTPSSRAPSSRVHIEIRFEAGEHGDGDPFDGPGGTLAHAYFPVYGGDAHFDAEEIWTIGEYKGTSLLQVASHEFGHSLGLSHSDVREALMAPFYRGYDPNFDLDDDDVQAIQALYGKKTQKTSKGGGSPSWGSSDDDSTNSPSAPGPTSNKLCKDSKIDTIFNSHDGRTFVFKGDEYYQLTEDSVLNGYPKKIAQSWPGLPGNIDAAFTYKNGKTYFFKGKQYWRYVDSKMDGNYPKDISVGFAGIPDDIDAATVWTGNGKIYFYKGSKFWRFDPTLHPPVKSAYPKPISNWQGLPNGLDAAFKDKNGYTYFFKDNAYYRFNDRAFAVENTNPAFPRSTAHWWFGCKEAPRGTIGTLGFISEADESDDSNNSPGDFDSSLDAVLRRLGWTKRGRGYIPEYKYRPASGH